MHKCVHQFVDFSSESSVFADTAQAALRQIEDRNYDA